MNPRLGDTFEASIWIDGRETVAQRARFEDELTAYLAHVAEREHVIIGPLMMHEKKPGDDRVPTVPDHIQGPDVRLLVGEAKVTGIVPTSYFTEDLEPDDLRRLRKITRRAYERHMPGQPRLSDRQCDTIINDLGPESAYDALRRDSVKLDKVLH